MTTTDPTTTSTDEASTPAARPHAPGAGFGTTATTTSRRTVLNFFRTPQILFMGSIQGALFLFMFRYVFGGAIRMDNGLKYVDFLVPGFLVSSILWTGMSAAAGVAEDATTGLYDRIRSLPVPRSAVIVGRSLADTTLLAWSILITGIIGWLVGFRPHSSAGSVLAGFLVILMGGWAFSWIFIFIGLVAKNAQAAQGMTMITIPFSFISSANVPVKTMPGWMQPFAANQPVSVIINAVRSLMVGGSDRLGIGHSTAYWIVLSLIWCAVILLVFGALASARFAKTK